MGTKEAAVVATAAAKESEYRDARGEEWNGVASRRAG